MPISNSKTQKHGLGRGFATLIPTDLLDESFDPTASQDQQVSELRQIKLDQIQIDPSQPRKDFSPEALEELAASIREHGVVQPIIVTPYSGGYQIVAGERRYRASKMAGLDKIPALVRTLTDQHKLELSLIENLHRKDLNPMEIATAYHKLRIQFNLTVEQIAKRVGNTSKAMVANRLRLLGLPKFVADKIVDGSITEGQARPLIILDPEIIKKILPKIISEGWSARKIEQFNADYKKNLLKNNGVKSLKTVISPYQDQLKRLQTKLKADVNISSNARGAGFIKIKFKNEEEFERLQKLLS